MREKANEHDPNAIAVYGSGRRLGYLSESKAAVYASLLDRLIAPAFLIRGDDHVDDGLDFWVAIPRLPDFRRRVGGPPVSAQLGPEPAAAAPPDPTAPLYVPTPGNPVPPFHRPFTHEKLPRPEWGEPVPRRYPNWRALGYADELDAAYWSHYRQRYWLDLEKRLTKAKPNSVTTGRTASRH